MKTLEFEFEFEGEIYHVIAREEGQHRPASWDWRGGDPEEFPTLEVIKLWQFVDATDEDYVPVPVDVPESDAFYQALCEGADHYC